MAGCLGVHGRLQSAQEANYFLQEKNLNFFANFQEWVGLKNEIGPFPVTEWPFSAALPVIEGREIIGRIWLFME